MKMTSFKREAKVEFTFLTFNYGTAGRYANGPGMCLHNLVTFLKSVGHKVHVFSILDSPYPEVTKATSINRIREKIDKSNVVHHWSGIDKSFAALCRYAKKRKKKVIIGPNLIDGVKVKEEKDYLSKTDFSKLVVVNDRLLYKISKLHDIPINKMDVFMVGPNPDEWFCKRDYEGEEFLQPKEDFILWKGNAKQPVKDVKFAIELAKKLKGKYKFKFIGHPKPYNYSEHIEEAKKAKLYICTSLSETMGLALAEQWAAGVPSITHPKNISSW